MELKELRERFKSIDRNINRAIDRLDLNLLNDLMDNRNGLLKRCLDGYGDNAAGNDEFLDVMDGVRKRGALIMARLNDKLRLVRKELKRLETGREVRKGYMVGGGYGSERGVNR